MDKAKVKTFGLRNLLLAYSGGFLAVYFLALIIQAFLFSTHFGPNVSIAGISLAGKNKDEAEKILQENWSAYSKEKIDIAGEKFLVSDLIEGVNYNETIDQALDDQRKDNLTFGAFKKRSLQYDVQINEGNVYKIISKHYNKDSTPAVDAVIVLAPTEKVIPEKTGKRILITESREAIITGLDNLSKNILLRSEDVQPALNEAEARNLLASAKKAVAQDITLSNAETVYTINHKTLEGWLKVESTNTRSLVERGAFDPEQEEARNYNFLDTRKVTSYVADLASKINKTAKNAKLTAKDGKVVVAESAVIGARLDTVDTITKIQEAALDHKKKELKVEIQKPEVTDNLSELGLNQLISTGWSDFRGSPANRVHNFTNGASKFNGVLIKPDEKFSFNKALGEVDASTGYLPELVILEDKTVPQYGGGLCQVSSTAFRAALNAGLPILERLYHAYPVSYYKPFGVDATIYLPKPDLVFQNDTGHYILIQTRVEGTKLFFDFYGTKANRTIKFSGNEKAEGAVDTVEKITPTIYDQDVRGKGSFTAVFYRHIYDESGKLTDNDKFTSKYDSPEKYPH